MHVACQFGVHVVQYRARIFRSVVRNLESTHAQIKSNQMFPCVIVSVQIFTHAWRWIKKLQGGKKKKLLGEEKKLRGGKKKKLRGEKKQATKK